MGKKGIQLAKDPPVMHITDLTTASVKKAKDFKAISANGAEGSLLLLNMSLVVKQKTVDRTGTLGSLWESRSNIGASSSEAGLAKLQTAFGADRISDAHVLSQAEQWWSLKSLVVDNLYVQTVGDQKWLPFRQLASLKLVKLHLLVLSIPRKPCAPTSTFSISGHSGRLSTPKMQMTLMNYMLVPMTEAIAVWIIQWQNDGAKHSEVGAERTRRGRIPSVVTPIKMRIELFFRKQQESVVSFVTVVVDNKILL
ncbi:hypothetical protein HPP92_006779 [Vanilla planifolia]|uniref:Uncharacterized protein n=1 Tax=Vanilla planifolia TaxID=51239 RepID=A0A835RJ29_VANPL|nr:hypothetical protein HPP92_007035 [Vanilla planifolia]KAG0489916.1 hypothetical protein HPP92_006779 [Vanilla planifolia]